MEVPELALLSTVYVLYKLFSPPLLNSCFQNRPRAQNGKVRLPRAMWQVKDALPEYKLRHTPSFFFTIHTNSACSTVDFWSSIVSNYFDLVFFRFWVEILCLRMGVCHLQASSTEPSEARFDSRRSSTARFVREEIWSAWPCINPPEMSWGATR